MWARHLEGTRDKNLTPIAKNAITEKTNEQSKKKSLKEKKKGIKMKTQDILNRPSWDVYFLSMAIAAAARSEDVFIKHGCVIVNDETHHIISTGYNGLPPKFDKSLINIYDRESRREYMRHSETNAIKNCLVPIHSLKSATMYITGQPCSNCLDDIVDVRKIKRIVHLDRVGTIKFSVHNEVHNTNILKGTGIMIDVYQYDESPLKEIFNLFLS